MNTMHEKGREIYKKWHSNPQHTLLHWSLFLAVSVLSASFLLKNIDQIASLSATDVVEYQSIEEIRENQLAATINALRDSTLFLNENFLNAADKYREKKGNQEEAALIEIAQKRAATISELAKKNPQMAYDSLLSEDELADLPANVRKHTEKFNVRLDGVYRQDHHDQDWKELKEETTIETNAGTYTVYTLDGKAPKGHGLKVRIDDAAQIEGAVLVSAGSNIKVEGGAVAAAAPAVHKLVAIIINGVATVSEVQAAMTQVDGLFREMSYGKTSVTTDVFEVTIPGATWSSSIADLRALGTKADDALRAKGVSVGNYSNIMYITSGCGGYCGIGEMPGNQTWVSGVHSGVMAHELGHNQGPHHASTPGAEYGEWEDVMGDAASMHGYNAPHRYQVGWIPSANVQSVTTSGTYTIASAETASAQKQVLKISKDSTHSLYVSLRQPSGIYDANLPSGVMVHQWVTNPGSTQTMSYGYVPVGQTFTDSKAGVTIKTIAIEGTNATVEVSIACLRAAPTLFMNNLTIAGGQPQTLYLNIVNNDSYTCPTGSTYSISAGLPGGWTQAAASVTIPAARELTVPLSITTPLSVVPGTYPVYETVVNTSNPNLTANISSNVTVSAPDTFPPIVTVYPTEGTLITTSRVAISAYANDPAPTNGVQTVSILFDGVLKKKCTGSSCSYTMNMSKVTKGQHTITAIAVDAAGNIGTAVSRITK